MQDLNLNQGFNEDEITFLEGGRGAENWSWPYRPKGWELLQAGEFLEFYKSWRGNPKAQTFGKNFPCELSLGRHSPFRYGTLGEKILITESYDKMFHRLLSIRMAPYPDSRGALIIGQPGIGKTVFLIYMLVRLMAADQVVLLYQASGLHLFYHGELYFRSDTSGFSYLPECRTKYLIWTLVDADFTEGGPPFCLESNIWPIQASSANPRTFAMWVEQYEAPTLGMPLWNMKELIEGFHLRPECDSFKEDLATPPRAPYGSVPSPIEAALQVLRKGRGREEEGRKEKETMETEIETDDGAEATATVQQEVPAAVQDQEMPDGADQARLYGYSMDDALEVLVRDATEAFGFVPRDVYKGVFAPEDVKRTHVEAMKNLDYSALKSLVKEFSSNKVLAETSHRVVAVHPTKHDLRNDDWAIDFKSVRIAEDIAISMRAAEDNQLREMLDTFRRYRELGSNLSGWTFKAIVHRIFSNGWSGADVPQPVSMIESNVPPMFSVNPSSSSPASVTSPLRAKARTAIRVEFTRMFASNVTLRDDVYYIPFASNNPFFDSFTIDADKTKPTAVISIFQITTSKVHHGSDRGYDVIHKVMNSVRKLIKARIPDEKARDKTKVEIKVAYFLVCPEDKLDHEWQMPTGWDKTTKANDHRGSCYFMRIPLTVWRVYSPLAL